MDNQGQESGIRGQDLERKYARITLDFVNIDIVFNHYG